MHAFILAGGFATRLWPLTETRAKPLLPLAGKPLLSHLVEQIPWDIPVTVSTNAAFKEGFEKWRQSIERENLGIVIEETKNDDEKLGTNGALAQWLKNNEIQEDVLLLTGDNYLGFSLKTFLQTLTPGVPLLAAYDIRSLEKAKVFGTVVLDADGKTVLSFEEKPEEPKSTLISTGCSVLPAFTLPLITRFARQHPDHIGGIFEEFLRQGIPVECFTFREPWFDIGSFEAYLEATKVLAGEQILLQRGSVCAETVCEGSVVIGADSHVHGSTLKNVVLFDDCHVENCILEECILDNRCLLKGVDLTGKMLREGTVLKKDEEWVDSTNL